MAALPEQDRIAIEIYEAATRIPRPRRRYLGMSQIGEPCDLKLWYAFRGYTPVPPDGRKILIFELGDEIEEILVRHLSAVGYTIEGRQTVFSAHGGYFLGHCDGIILPAFGTVVQNESILECKSANRSKFESFCKIGVRETYPVYYCQVQCYMGYANLGQALVVIYCKDSSEIYSEWIPFSRNDFTALHERAYRIITTNPEDASSPREIFGSRASNECRWCDYRFHCEEEGGSIIMADDMVCGTCWYMHWKGLAPWCFHPDHPYKIETRGIRCPDWSYEFAKFQRDKANRKPLASIEELREI